MLLIMAGILEYSALATLYSLLAAAMVEALLSLWHVQDPPLAVRFRVLILAIPPVAPVLFALINPDRGTATFRGQTALLDLHNWLGPDSGPSSPGWVLLLAVMAVTTALLVAPEATGLIRHLLGRRAGARRVLAPAGRLQDALARLAAGGLPSHQVLVAEQPEPTAYTVGLLRPAILVTPLLVELLDDQELEGVLAHEIAHIKRRDNWLGWLTFGLRLASFYNPVALFTFHQISHDLERVCDREAANATGRPLALASALIKAYRASHKPAERGHGWPEQAVRRATALENRARRTLVEDRAKRLVHPETVCATSYPAFRLGLALVGVLGLAYLVV